MRLSEVLNADQMALNLYVAGQSTVGIGISGTWVGTLAFYGSVDGISNFIPLSATPYPSGTAVSSVTTTGNWQVAVQGFSVIRVVFTRTSGSATVIMSASNDASWQDAFLSTTSIYPNSAATAAVNTLTQAASTNRAWCLQALKISINKQPSFLTSPNVQILDGATVLWQFDLPQVGSAGIIYDIALPEGGITNTPGNSLGVVVANAGSGATSQINAKVRAA